jgi:hypothetical protein
MSVIDGTSVGIMVDSTAEGALAHNNTVTGMYDAPNVPPNYQIVVGAYTFYAGGSTYVPIFKDNHCDGGTMTHPDYNITGEQLGGGWVANAHMVVDVPGDAMIHAQNANVTLRHNGQLYAVTQDSEKTFMEYFSNGTSSRYFPKVDLNHHFINVTVLGMTIAVNADVRVTVSIFDPDAVDMDDTVALWNTTVDDPDATYMFTVSGLRSDGSYKVIQDGVVVGTGFGPSFSFTVSGNGTFEIVAWYPATVSRLVVLTVNMLAMGLLVGVIGAAITPLRDPKNRNPEKFGKVVLNTVICIVVGIILITVVNNMFLG